MMAQGPRRQDISFEEALEKLESLVARMETGDLPLEEIVNTYEEGMKLVALCAARLEAAEKKIELLTRDKSGNVLRSEFPEEGKGNGIEMEDDTERDDSLF